MAKSSYEKALEKQQREQKKLADQEARRQRASSIVSGQPYMGGMRIMDSASEEMLQSILNLYKENEERLVQGNYNDIPKAYHSSLPLEMEKLSMYGMVSNPRVWISSMWEATLTPQGLSYFQDKKDAAERGKTRILTVQERKQYDVFISHASKDKLDYVDLLYATVRRLGVKIFYDTEEISWGDNWKQVILNGTEQSEFAIIVISRNFFGREWTERELKEFLNRQNTSGQKIILPLLHGISVEDMKNKYPELEDIQAIDTDRYTKEDIVILFAKEMIKRLR